MDKTTLLKQHASLLLKTLSDKQLQSVGLELSKIDTCEARTSLNFVLEEVRERFSVREAHKYEARLIEQTINQWRREPPYRTQG